MLVGYWGWLMLSAFIKHLNRQQWISEAAYYKALDRGFESDHELSDWLAAEQDYSTMLIDVQLNVLEEDGNVTIMGLQEIAESLGVSNAKQMRSEPELIHAIQEASHQQPCFQAKGSAPCEKQNCPWKSKCRRLVAIWYR